MYDSIGQWDYGVVVEKQGLIWGPTLLAVR